MRGRLYDARIGRFMQADPPFMESPGWSQGLNRYSYVFNNPLNLVDPSGFDVGDPGTFDHEEKDDDGDREVFFGDDPLSAHGQSGTDQSSGDEGDTSPSEDPDEGDSAIGELGESLAADDWNDDQSLGGMLGPLGWGPTPTPSPLQAPPPPGLPNGTGPRGPSTKVGDVPNKPPTGRPPTGSVKLPGWAAGFGELIGWIPLILSVPGDEEQPQGPNWSWKSTKTFGHTFKTHGSGQKNTQKLLDRSRTPGQNPTQGQWTDNDKAAEFLESLDEVIMGPAAVQIPLGIGQVIHSDGSITPASWALVAPNPDGGYISAFPIDPSSLAALGNE